MQFCTRSNSRLSVHRQSRFEPLEERLALSATPPTVEDVVVSSTAWNQDFVDYLETNNLGTGGYSIPDGGTAQSDPLPWNNLDQILITFSEDVLVEAADLSVSGVAVTAYTFADFHYDAQTHTATWTLSTTIAADRIRLDLDADGLDPVTDVHGNLLDGEWADNVSSYSSGDLTQGGDFEFTFEVLPADANQTGVVSSADFSVIVGIRDKTTEDVGYNPTRDLDGSGLIDADDYYYVIEHMQDTVPMGNPAGADNDAPTTSGLADVHVEEDAVDHVMSLFDAFDDLEDADTEIDFEVVGNTNSGLFDSITFDDTTGELTLDFAADQHGAAELTIRATDSGGLVVETTFDVLIDPVNDAPVISAFEGSMAFGIWTFTGMVKDVDHNPAGWTVDFFGVLEGESAVVQADGSFTFLIELDPGTFGTCWVQTEDPLGAVSNQPQFFVGVT